MTTQEIFAFLRDHYWDTLEGQRDLLEAHLASCEKMIGQAEEASQAPQPTREQINEWLSTPIFINDTWYTADQVKAMIEAYNAQPAEQRLSGPGPAISPLALPRYEKPQRASSPKEQFICYDCGRTYQQSEGEWVRQQNTTVMVWVCSDCIEEGSK